VNFLLDHDVPAEIAHLPQFDVQGSLLESLGSIAPALFGEQESADAHQPFFPKEVSTLVSTQALRSRLCRLQLILCNRQRLDQTG
jgi:hypothetical protein